MLTLLASAYDFMVDGLAYNHIDINKVEVTYQNSSVPRYPSLSGDLVIPSSVTYDGTTYSVTSIGSNAFFGCRDLTSITIGNAVTSIGTFAFGWCSGLTGSITIPSSVTSISIGIFAGCSGIESISVEAENVIYDSRNNCNAIIESASNTLITGCKKTVIPNSVTLIGNNAFRDCSGMTSITIPNSVASIGISAFFGCSGLASVIVPNSVTTIGGNAFRECTGLTSITIPNSVTSIGHDAFNGCNGLTEIRSKIVDVNSVVMDDDVFYNVPTSSCTLQVPVGTADAYRDANQWYAFSTINEMTLIPSGTVGDLNCDHVVDGTDINLMVNHLLQTSNYVDEDGATDVDGDGESTALDLNRMIRIILGQ